MRRYDPDSVGDEKTVRKIVSNLAYRFLGFPYIWGGDSPRRGFDCSGLVIWVLQVVGILYPGDDTADGLSKTFPQTERPKTGDLVVYGKPDRITHVGFYVEIEGEPFCISASGGDQTTTTEEEAKKRNAEVKLRHVKYRKDFQGYRNIFGRA